MLLSFVSAKRQFDDGGQLRWANDGRADGFGDGQVYQYHYTC